MWLNSHQALLDFARKHGRQGADEDLKLFGEGKGGLLRRGGGGSAGLRAKRRYCWGKATEVKDPLLETDFSGCPEGVGEVMMVPRDFWLDYYDDEEYQKYLKELDEEKQQKAEKDGDAEGKVVE